MKNIVSCIALLVVLISCDDHEKSTSDADSHSKTRSRTRPLQAEFGVEKDPYAEPRFRGSMPSFETLVERVKLSKSQTQRVKLLEKIIFSEGRENSKRLEQLIEDTFDDPDRTMLLEKLALESAKTNNELYLRIMKSLAPGVKRNALIKSGFDEMNSEQLLNTMLVLQQNALTNHERGSLDILATGVRPPAKTIQDLKYFLSFITIPDMREAIIKSFAKTITTPADLVDSQLLSAIPENYRADFVTESVGEMAKSDLSILNILVGSEYISQQKAKEIINNQANITSSKSTSLEDILSQTAKLNEPTATHFMEETSYIWVKHNYQLAKQTVENLPPSRNRDIIMKSLSAHSIESGRLDEATKWISLIDDKNVKDQASKYLISE